jgi:hypothetical protein
MSDHAQLTDTALLRGKRGFFAALGRWRRQLAACTTSVGAARALRTVKRK